MTKIGKIGAAALMTGLLCLALFPVPVQADDVCIAPAHVQLPGQPPFTCPQPSGQIIIIGNIIISGGGTVQA